MRAIALFCILSLAVTGCLLEDSFAHKTVSLSLPKPAQPSKTSFSADDPQVQEAMKLIDGVLVSRGYVCVTNALAPEDRARGVIAFYGVCGVGLKDDRLEVGFGEEHRRHLSAPVQEVIAQLKDRLSSRYGAQNVRVEE